MAKQFLDILSSLNFYYSSRGGYKLDPWLLSADIDIAEVSTSLNL